MAGWFALLLGLALSLGMPVPAAAETAGETDSLTERVIAFYRALNAPDARMLALMSGSLRENVGPSEEYLQNLRRLSRSVRVVRYIGAWIERDHRGDLVGTFAASIIVCSRLGSCFIERHVTWWVREAKAPGDSIRWQWANEVWGDRFSLFGPDGIPTRR